MHTMCYPFFMDIFYKWNPEKNEKLKEERDICFKQIVMHIEKGDLLDIIEHPNQKEYSHQKMLIVNVGNYVYLVPFFEVNEQTYSLITIMPSRKATKIYLRGEE